MQVRLNCCRIYTITSLTRGQTAVLEIARFDNNAGVVSVPVTVAEQDILRELWEKRKSPATYRAYGSDWRSFQIFCHGIGCQPLPAEPKTVARYLGHLKTART